MGTLDAASVSAGDRGESVEIEDGGVGQGIDLQIAPEPFDRIECRGVGRQEDCMAVRRGSEEGFGIPGTMGIEAIPDQHDGARNTMCAFSARAFFLARGPSSLIHCAMRASSRSTATLAGR